MFSEYTLENNAKLSEALFFMSMDAKFINRLANRYSQDCISGMNVHQCAQFHR